MENNFCMDNPMFIDTPYGAMLVKLLLADVCNVGNVGTWSILVNAELARVS